MNKKTPLHENICEILKANGGGATREKIFSALGMKNKKDKKEYWPVEQKLVDDQIITRKPGRGGGLFLVENNHFNGEEIGKTKNTQSVRKEAEYYIPLAKEIETNGQILFGFENAFAQVVANLGSLDTGGKWSRADIIVLAVSKWIFSSRLEGDVRTIEVKLYQSVDVTGVYEALSHRSQAHFAYLFIVGYPESADIDSTRMSAIFDAASRHGIGVVTVVDENDIESWSIEVEARRSDADPRAINDLLLNGSVKADVRDKFEKSLRTFTASF